MIVRYETGAIVLWFQLSEETSIAWLEHSRAIFRTCLEVIHARIHVLLDSSRRNAAYVGKNNVQGCKSQSYVNVKIVSYVLTKRHKSGCDAVLCCTFEQIASFFKKILNGLLGKMITF